MMDGDDDAGAAAAVEFEVAGGSVGDSLLLVVVEVAPAAVQRNRLLSKGHGARLGRTEAAPALPVLHLALRLQLRLWPHL